MPLDRAKQPAAFPSPWTAPGADRTIAMTVLVAFAVPALAPVSTACCRTGVLQRRRETGSRAALGASRSG
jgi:hypothetical protein